MTVKCRFCDSDISTAPLRPLPFAPVAGETPTSGLVYFLLAFVILLVSLVLGPVGPPLLVFVSAVWVAFDAGTHKLGQYNHGLGGPTTACLGSLLLWIIVFPWYLAVRSRIRSGVQPVKA